MPAIHVIKIPIFMVSRNDKNECLKIVTLTQKKILAKEKTPFFTQVENGD